MSKHNKHIIFKIKLILIFLFLQTNTFAQIYNYMTAGAHKIYDLNTFPPVYKGSLDIYFGAMSTICDSMGRLKLVSLGTYIYNSNLESINKNGFMNCQFACKDGSILVPSKVKGVYYYFYLHNGNGKCYKPGMSYAIIDVNADGGKGAVVDTHTFYSTSNYEHQKLIVAPHQNKGEFWIISPNVINHKIFAWHFDGVKIANYVVYNDIEPYFCKSLIEDFSGQCYSVTTNNLFYLFNSKEKDSIVLKQYVFNNKSGILKHKATHGIRKFDYLDSSRMNPKYTLDAEITESDTVLYIALSYRNEVITDSTYLIQYGFDKNMNINAKKTHKIKYSIKDLRLSSDDKLYYLMNLYLNYRTAFALSVITNNATFRIKEIFPPVKKNYARFYMSSNIHENLLVRFYSNYKCRNIVEFTNQSDFSKYENFTWYFPNGDSSNTYHSTYVFLSSGQYVVKLKAVTPAGYTRWAQDTINYIKPTVADFITDTSIGCQWLKFKFYDSSKSDTVHPVLGESWLWDFGDGTSGMDKNPEHIYTKTGKYSIKLIYSNGFCSDTIEKEQAVNIIDAPRPGFKMSQINYCSPYTLDIKDTSFGKVTTYFYDFGDSAISNSSSPTHYYPYSGNYKILQVLTGPTGCVTKDSAILHLRKGFNGTEKINSLTVNVLNNDSITVNWFKHPDAFSYEVFRKSENEDYDSLLNQTDSFYYDKFVKAKESIYSYKIYAKDSCYRSSAASSYLKNILLTGESIGNEYAILKWTPFELWYKGVDKYIIEYKNLKNDFESFISLNDKEYIDNNYYSDELEFEKCYRIRAIEKEGNKQQSISNVLCIPYKAVIFIPTAFSPNGDGTNDNFFVKGVNIEKFQMEIFNSWGQKIFESSNIDKGWDGIYKNKKCVQGNYYYFIKIKTGQNEHKSYNGVVSLIR
ncbi:MAG: gliding motility-associated C-terminal domain-containing protein [Bacteroidota bacterium]|nr:gliding motility-associated C-terminal domain-containing protein [Bacteroidota bacterium]